MSATFELVAKTLKGLEEVLAEELRSLGAQNVTPGCRMVSFEGDLAMMYRANVRCRTALSILKPIYKFTASNPEDLYEAVKEYDWGTVMSIGKTFSIDSTVHSNEFTNSRYVVYRVKDGIVDWFKDRFGEDKRPAVSVSDADVSVNVHIDGERITLSLNSSGESLHKRGWRVAQTEAPINEVLAAGMILKSGWRGDAPFVDPMCGSGTFLIEAAMIAADIAPGTYRKSWAFENWRDYDGELLEQVMGELQPKTDIPFKIYGSDASPKAMAIAERNVLSAGVDDFVSLRVRSIQQWDKAPVADVPGVLITNPPYGERLNFDDLMGLYRVLGTKLKHVFCGWHSWIISSNERCLDNIGLTPSLTEELQNGGIDCQLREYVTFEGSKSDFRRSGGEVKREPRAKESRPARKTDGQWREEAGRKGLVGRRSDRRSDRTRELSPRDRQHRGPEKSSPLSERYRPKKGGFARNEESRRRFKEETARLSEAEEILDRRRSERVLRELGESPSRPSLPTSEGPFMRTRRRWKRPEQDGGTSGTPEKD